MQWVAPLELSVRVSEIVLCAVEPVGDADNEFLTNTDGWTYQGGLSWSSLGRLFGHGVDQGEHANCHEDNMHM